MPRDVAHPQSALIIKANAAYLLHSIKYLMMKYVLTEIDNRHVVFAREPQVAKAIGKPPVNGRHGCIGPYLCGNELPGLLIIESKESILRANPDGAI